jgi:hypothetical protein
MYNLDFIVLYCLHKCNSLRVVILSLFFLHVAINLIVVTNRNTRWHWLLKIIRCEWGHQVAVISKNCVCSGIVKVRAAGENLCSVEVAKN